jgi:hypothetical protein
MSTMAAEHSRSDKYKAANRVGRYYTPDRRIMQGRITVGPGIQYRQWGIGFDEYVGEAAALEAAGLLRSELLPPDGHNMITWRPEGYRRDDENHWQTPGHMTIRRGCSIRDRNKGVPTGAFTVLLAVSREERARRVEAVERRKLEAIDKARMIEKSQRPAPARGGLRLVWSAPQ